MTVDPSLDSVSAMTSLALQFKDIPLTNIEFVTAPWEYDGDRIDLIQPDTDILWELVRDDDTLEGQNVSGGTPSASATTPATPTVPGTDPTSGTPSSEPYAPQDYVTGTAVTNPSSSATATSTVSADPSDPYTPPDGYGDSDEYGEYGASPDASMPITSIPTSITENIRPADSDACSDITYGGN
jgi:hypothetical protein